MVTAPRPIALGCMAVHSRIFTALCPRKVWRCIVGGPRPLPPSSVAVLCMIFATPSPEAVWHCITGVPRPTYPRQCGGALQQFHYLMLPHNAALYDRNSLPTVAVP